MSRLLGRLSGFLEYIAAATLILMMLHVLVDVVGRQVFNLPAPATTEFVAYYYMIAAVFLPFPFVELKDRAIAVDLFYNMFSPRLKRMAKGLGMILAAFFFGALAFKSSIDAWNAYQKGEMIEGLYNVIIWPVRFGLPVSFSLTCLILFSRFYSEVILGKDPALLDPETEEHLAEHPVEEGIE